MSNANADLPHLNRPTRGIWLKGVGLALVIFASGVVLGVSMSRTYYLQQERERFFRPRNMPADLVDSLSIDLQLSPEQHAAVLAVFQKHHEQMEALRAKIQPEVDIEMEGVRSEVAKSLTNEQLRRWDMRTAQMRSRFRSTAAPPLATPSATAVEVETPEKVAP